MIPHLNLGDWPEPYAALLWILFALFVARVVGQILAATVHPRWLPPMARWYSGIMPYRYLLPSQLLIIILMSAMAVGVTNEAGPLGRPSRSLGLAALWASYVYGAGMVWRAVRWTRQPPERKGVLIPIVFHFVLAGFLFAYGSWHFHVSGVDRSRAIIRFATRPSETKIRPPAKLDPAFKLANDVMPIPTARAGVHITVSSGGTPVMGPPSSVRQSDVICVRFTTASPAA